MTMFRSVAIAAAVGVAALAAPVLTAPAAAATVDNSDPSRFITTLSSEAFRVLRTGSKASARPQFRQLLGQYFAIDEIGDRLIRRWRPQISPAQYQAYQAALPGFLIGTYADRLYDYSDAKVTVVRAIPRGDGAAVQSTVVRPGANPVTAIWTVQKVGGGYKITNLTVAGVNLVLTQTADFDSYVQKNGFDKLVAFMKSRSS
ncbi:MlaC/ttg2D family ABC transporter substrate-binding protein [Sphingomonas morindae]|uniref:ABC transporter substrate-binding protein n=1 Tax=Sphingomonas morindae TaxID=1541170 RepID=A0ABY4X874_9SPHN|nr:ABC transporter substrate-binding protein [Sphingomonas morindae]USI73035.1 ABC transporter substrate-binding protein [Sphingomonas morindae]